MKKLALFTLVVLSFSNVMAMSEGRTKCKNSNSSTTPAVTEVASMETQTVAPKSDSLPRN